MGEQRDILIFNSSPDVEVGTNRFIDVPVILQYADAPLIEVVQFQPAGFTTQFSIYHSDGAKLAVAKGSRLFLTPDGQKADLHLRHPPNMTVCELAGQTLFEIRRKDAAALSTKAELHAPDGRFIRCADDELVGQVLRGGDSFLQVGSMKMEGNEIVGFPIGILIEADGTIAIGVKRR